MNLDEALSQPLAPVRDDGFSASVVLRLAKAEERRRLLLWGAAALALLPPLALLPVTAADFALAAITQAACSPIPASVAGALVLLWAIRPATAKF